MTQAQDINLGNEMVFLMERGNFLLHQTKINALERIGDLEREAYEIAKSKQHELSAAHRPRLVDCIAATDDFLQLIDPDWRKP